MLLDSRYTTGTVVINLADNAASSIFIRLIGVSGQVAYTLDTNFIPTLTNVPMQICVATDDGTRRYRQPAKC